MCLHAGFFCGDSGEQYVFLFIQIAGRIQFFAITRQRSQLLTDLQLKSPPISRGCCFSARSSLLQSSKQQLCIKDLSIFEVFLVLFPLHLSDSSAFYFVELL